MWLWSLTLPTTVLGYLQCLLITLSAFGTLYIAQYHFASDYILLFVPNLPHSALLFISAAARNSRILFLQ